KAILQIEVSDEHGRPMPCRIHLFDPAGKAVAAPGLPFWKDHFVCSGRVTLTLSPGRYRIEVERGPEHERRSLAVEVKPGRDHTLRLRLDRVAHLARQGWYGGDL